MTENIVKKFSSSEFGELRVVKDEGGVPWFVAKDVCAALGIKNSRQALTRLASDEKGVVSNDTLGGPQKMAAVNEYGLYALVLSAKKKEARAFQRWVTHDVLPSIRKDGGYMTVGEDESDEQVMARALILAQKALDRSKQRIKEMEPKALFADAVTGSDTTCLVADLAKILTQNGFAIGQNRLFELLRSEGYLGNAGMHHNVPTQRAMEMELFEIRETVVMRSTGAKVRKTPRVTQKGVKYFVNRYIGKKVH